MIAESDLAAGKELKTLFPASLALEKTRIFGSRAGGDADSDSDRDVMVVLQRGKKKRSEIPLGRSD